MPTLGLVQARSILMQHKYKSISIFLNLSAHIFDSASFDICLDLQEELLIVLFLSKRPVFTHNGTLELDLFLIN